MRRRRRPILIPLALLIGCVGPPDSPEVPLLPPEASGLSLRPVDAGSGEAISDGTVRVRHLVRTPIALDAAGVEEVSSSEPYRVTYEVSTDSLVVEVRLEAASYQRIDTVLAVARGGDAGPFTLPMTRVAGRAASNRRPASTTPARTQPARAAPPEPDRTAMRAGDQAFNASDWSGAASAYLLMPRPNATTGAYARDYLLARVRQGISQINTGDWEGARTALQEAVDLNAREYTPYFYLGQVQCTLREYTAGRQTLSQVERLFETISEAQRPIVLALVEYQRAVCSHGEYTSALAPAARERARQQARADLQRFIDRGEAMPSVPAQIQAALSDARTRLRSLSSGG